MSTRACSTSWISVSSSAVLVALITSRPLRTITSPSTITPRCCTMPASCTASALIGPGQVDRGQIDLPEGRVVLVGGACVTEDHAGVGLPHSGATQDRVALVVAERRPAVPEDVRASPYSHPGTSADEARDGVVRAAGGQGLSAREGTRRLTSIALSWASMTRQSVTAAMWRERAAHGVWTGSPFRHPVDATWRTSCAIRAYLSGSR